MSFQTLTPKATSLVRSVLLLAISILLMAYSLTAQAIDLTASANALPMAADIARIKSRGELVVAMVDSDYPPFFYERHGEVVGLDIDLAKAIAKELNVKLRLKREAKTFDAVIDLVARRQADLGISNLSRTLARSQLVHFSTPYLKLNHALLLNRLAFARQTPNTRLEDAVRQFGGSLGVLSGSAFVDLAARHFPKAQIRRFATWNEIVAALQKGDLVGAYLDEIDVRRLFKSDPAAALTLRTVTLKDVEGAISVAVGVGDPTLLAFVNLVLEQQGHKWDIRKVLEALESKS